MPKIVGASLDFVGATRIRLGDEIHAFIVPCAAPLPRLERIFTQPTPNPWRLRSTVE